MNLNKKYIIISFLLLTLWSCQDFLEVDKKGTMSEKEMFQDVDGFNDALSGIYASLGTRTLYGENMSNGLVDYFAQYFTGRQSSYGKLLVKVASNLEYDDVEVKSTIENTWQEAYFVIAATNNFLKQIDETSISNFTEKDKFKAEALSVRAFLHFDLFRLFGGFYPEDKDKISIPYSTDFSKIAPSFYTNKEIVERVLADLDNAENLFAKSEIKADEYEEIYFDIEAVWALKARVYNYIKDYGNARKYAENVLNSKKFKMSNGQNYNLVNHGYLAKSSTSGKDFNECILGVFSASIREYLTKKFSVGRVTSSSVFVRPDYEEVFNSGVESASLSDVRFNDGIEVARTGVHLVKFSQFNEEEKDEALRKGRISGLNLIRLPEMYYILANAYYEKDKSKSVDYLNVIMRSRGLLGLAEKEISSRSEFNKVLLSEIQKEYWGEGQLFFAHKSLRVDILSPEKKIFHANKQNFVIPIPEKK